MNGVRQRSLAVSVHDVSPLTRDTVAVMLRDLAEAGVRVTSLLVVPDHHHRADIDQDPAFLGWLRGMEAEGHEIVLHGFYHRREASARRRACRFGRTAWTRKRRAPDP